MVRDVDPALAVDAVIPMEAVLSGITTRPRFYATLLSAFGAIAGFIAAIGIYGVLAYSVTQRTREIGLRMALGAPRAGVLGAIVKEGMLIALAGVAAGLAAAFAFSRALEGLVFGIRVNDPATFAGVAAVLSVVALVACALPAMRASRVDPIVALRQE
jgi:putative ABC transport system permease protein